MPTQPDKKGVDIKEAVSQLNSKLNILLVEDNPEDAEQLRQSLVPSARFELTLVERLATAMQRLNEERFDLSLVDLSLPDSQGLDTLVKLHQQAPGVPIVVLTDLDDESTAIKAVEIGAQDCLVKGKLDSQLLARSIYSAIGRHQRWKKLEHRAQAEVAEIQCHMQRQAVLNDINLVTTSTLNLRAVLGVLLETIDHLLPNSAATVRLLNRESGALEPVSCRNIDEGEWKARMWESGNGFAKAVLENKGPLVIANVQTEPHARDPEFLRKYGLVSYLGFPLIVRGEILGVLGLYTKEEHEFSEEEMKFLTTLAGQAAVAIRNAQLYEQTERQAVELEKANKVRIEFLNVLSQELRTPVNVIVGYVGMIQGGMLGGVNQEQEEALGKVLSRSRDLLAMISGILEATKIEADAVKVESHEVNLREFLDELRLAYDVPDFPLDKGLTLLWDYPPELPVIRTDNEKLRYIMQNLISNAIKFTKQGSVTVSARYFSGKRTVAFKVTDTGIGILKEDLPIIFEQFRQVDSSETRSHGGVGVGLFIAKKFTELMGGKIEVESEPANGSTFTVTIPYENEKGALP